MPVSQPSVPQPSWLPDDADQALLLGRVDFGDGPTPVLLRGGELFDLSATAPTISGLLESLPPGAEPTGRRIGDLDQLVGPTGPRSYNLLAPVDLQCLKAAGVTFAVSMLERVIEERAGGDTQRALAIRAALGERVGRDLRGVKPGSPPAARLKAALHADGLWSQYLEVAIGPDAEIFTKAPILSAVGGGADTGVRADSHWNKPEPEVVLVCDSQGRPRGAALGKAKDNNASCAIGPFLRLFDARFTLDDVRDCTFSLSVQGQDGFELRGESSMRLISRDPLELVAQTCGASHQHPDGVALFLGTMFAPVTDRDQPGQSFTHKVCDRVRIATPRLGLLENRVTHSETAAPWTFGVGAVMHNLARRGLLA